MTSVSISRWPLVATGTQNGILILPHGILTLTTRIFRWWFYLSRAGVYLDITTYENLSHQVKTACSFDRVLHPRCQEVLRLRLNTNQICVSRWHSYFLVEICNLDGKAAACIALSLSDSIWAFSRIIDALADKKTKSLSELGKVQPAAMLTIKTLKENGLDAFLLLISIFDCNDRGEPILLLQLWGKKINEIEKKRQSSFLISLSTMYACMHNLFWPEKMYVYILNFA